MHRRSFLQLGVSAAAAGLSPRWLMAQAAGAKPTDMVAQARAAAANTEIKTTRLFDNVYLLQGAGGNMAVQTGPEGKILIDSSFSSAVPRLRQALNALGSDPPELLINTHWHYDHTDGNEGVHAAGFTILAHAMTRERLSKPWEVKLFGVTGPAAPPGALPAATFDSTLRLYHNGDTISLVHFDPAHTDTDIYIHFEKANVLHMGDTWFNGFYPFIDESSGGNIDGMVHAAEKGLSLAGPDTKIIPGHGPLGTKAQLQATRDMLAGVGARSEVEVVRSIRAGGDRQETARRP